MICLNKLKLSLRGMVDVWRWPSYADAAYCYLRESQRLYLF
jgi:hypothetical protein